MQRLIDADDLLMDNSWAFYDENGNRNDACIAVENAPTVDAEPTEEQVKEYCRKRCLAVVDNELFNEMKARWSAEPVRYGHWINHFDDLFPEDSSVECSVCHEYEGIMANDNYCPNCGAKMDEVTEDAETD